MFRFGRSYGLRYDRFGVWSEGCVEVPVVPSVYIRPDRNPDRTADSVIVGRGRKSDPRSVDYRSQAEVSD